MKVVNWDESAALPPPQASASKPAAPKPAPARRVSAA